MKNKWLGITLTILVGLILVFAVGFMAFRVGTFYGSKMVASEGLKSIVVSGEKGELPEDAYLEKFPVRGQYFSNMMGSSEYFDGFHGMMGSFGYRDNFRGFYPMDRFNSPMGSFSFVRGLFSLVLLAGLILLIIFIVKALQKTGHTYEKAVFTSEPETIETKQK